VPAAEPNRASCKVISCKMQCSRAALGAGPDCEMSPALRPARPACDAPPSADTRLAVDG